MTNLERARQVRIAALSDIFDDPMVDEMSRIDMAIASEIDRVARRCVEIALKHGNEWIRTDINAPVLPVGSHACGLIAEEIRREFGLEEGR
jgi:hypothetical protein